MHQIFGHFQTDEAASDDHRAGSVVLLDPGLDLVAVGNVSQLEDAREIAARELRNEGLGACGKHQVVVSLLKTTGLGANRTFTFLQKSSSSPARIFSRGLSRVPRAE